MAADSLDRAARLHVRVVRDDAALRALRDDRDEAIRAALAGGLTQRAVADAVGITPAMVARIAHGGR